MAKKYKVNTQEEFNKKIDDYITDCKNSKIFSEERYYLNKIKSICNKLNEFCDILDDLNIPFKLSIKNKTYAKNNPDISSKNNYETMWNELKKFIDYKLDVSTFESWLDYQEIDLEIDELEEKYKLEGDK